VNRIWYNPTPEVSILFFLLVKTTFSYFLSSKHAKNKTMPDTKDYTQHSLEELLAEQKKLKKHELYAALAIGFLVGVMVFGIV
jgi:hypothetical protein